MVRKSGRFQITKLQQVVILFCGFTQCVKMCFHPPGNVLKTIKIDVKTFNRKTLKSVATPGIIVPISALFALLYCNSNERAFQVFCEKLICLNQRKAPTEFCLKIPQIRNFLRKYTMGLEVASSSENGIFATKIINFYPISANSYAIYHFVNS